MGLPAIAGASLGLQAAGHIVQGIGAKQSADAQAAAYTYKAGVAKLNQQINKQNANWAIEAGEAQAVTSGMKSKQQIGETKVVQAASGFDVNSGTAAQVRRDQTDIANYNQNVIRWDAAKTAYGYETKAVMDDAEANLAQMASASQKQAGDIMLAGSFLNAAGTVSSKWMAGSSAGLWGGGSSGGGGTGFSLTNTGGLY